MALGITQSWKILLAWPCLLCVGITFSCLALIFNALAKGYDFFTYYFTLFLTPMMFLSGVFFPSDQLPSWVRSVADFLPLSQAVALVRPLFLDRWPEQAFLHLGALAMYAGIAWVIALHFTRKRFRNWWLFMSARSILDQVIDLYQDFYNCLTSYFEALIWADNIDI